MFVILIINMVTGMVGMYIHSGGDQYASIGLHMLKTCAISHVVWCLVLISLAIL